MNPKPLDPSRMTEAMETIVSGRAEDAAIEAFLLGLRAKGETAEEVTAAARVMRAHSLKLTKSYPDLVDTCGTGGDARHTFNVSTLAAITAAAAGVRIGKHGNRAVSSVCGSADLLEALGMPIDLTVPAIERLIDETGFGFFFAPKFHPATRFAMPARKRIRGKTIFNILGPLSNPAGAGIQLLGVYEERLVELLARALLQLGTRRALVVHGKDGLDEITLCDETLIAEVREGKIERRALSPEDCGLKRAALSDFTVSSKEECAETALQILKGGKGPKSDLVNLNAGAALYLAGKARSIKEGVEAAVKISASGAPFRKLEAIIGSAKKALAESLSK
ncbi:MAG: anthranilate phosphoribosyltransferase [Candidatus Omnitrophica bacterium]|nr:anthranilate phosphoribosyltransferase [Candidatus Omnitrophota bacterium]